VTRLLSVEKVAELLDLSESSVLRLIRRGELACVRPSARKVKIEESEIAAFIQRKRVPSVHEQAAVRRDRMRTVKNRPDDAEAAGIELAKRHGLRYTLIRGQD
jgi:excisionase family DNA binding protein